MQIKGKNINTAIVVYHCLFWLTWIVVFTVIQSLGKGYDEGFVWLMYYLITLPIFISHTYIIAYWLVPVYFQKRRFILFSAGIIVFLVIFSMLELVVSNEIVFELFDVNKKFVPGYLNPANILISGIGNHYIIFVFVAIRVVKSWHITKDQKEELAIQNLETELEIYKYRLQPKFILSLINELDQMSESRSKKVPEMIVKISDFINRLLFEAKAELIQLESEIILIREFLNIQKLAIGKRLKSNLVINGKTEKKIVPPLLIFPFLNMACHVVNSNNLNFECNVVIKIERNYTLFSFTLWSESDFVILKDDDIGLVKKRLEYSYGSKYRIIENEDANFQEISIEIFA